MNVEVWHVWTFLQVLSVWPYCPAIFLSSYMTSNYNNSRYVSTLVGIGAAIDAVSSSACRNDSILLLSLNIA